MLGEIVAKCLHLLVVGSMQRDVGDGVEADEIDPALQALDEPHYLAGMHHRVVDTTEDDILEGAAALMGEVILLEQCHNVGYCHLSFGRHEGETLLVERRVHTDGDVALALVEESLELVLYSHTADGDALGAPLITPIGSEHLCGSQHVVEVVHRFALSHEHDIGERGYLGQRVDLIEDVGCGEIALKTLFAGLTEEAVHLAPHLRRHAERGPVAVGDIHSLDKLAACCGEEILDGAVL